MLRHLTRHDIWISEKLKSDYLKNEKSFRNEIKNILKCSLLEIQNKAAKMERTKHLNRH